MQYKKPGFIKAFLTTVKRFFRARNIIIISEHKVGHVPLSGTMQILLCLSIIGFFSGGSYITGSYMSARSAIAERDQKIVTTAQESSRVSGELALLKRDLQHLSQNGTDLSAYNKYASAQYGSTSAQSDSLNTSTSFAAENLFGQSNEKLVERIAYLENRVGEVREENDHLVTAIRERTDKKIDYFDDIIAMTGLDSGRLERMAASGGGEIKNPSHESTVSHAIVTAPAAAAEEADPSTDPADDSASGKEAKPHVENQGGPFIPYDAALNDSDRELLENVDRMVVLHNIVEQLPLSQPIESAQITGPFGKRVDPLNGRWAIHPGVDLAGPMEAHIYSTSAGKVVSAGRKIAYGNMVDIDHGFGIVTRYAHMSKILVHEGQMVHKGQLIGLEGSTGRSTGPHLHYEVRINDRPVNPVKFLHAGEYVLQN